MSFGSASAENAVSKAYHSLTLIAGLEATKDNKTRPVDLNVRGGAIFNKNMVVCGNIDVESFLNGNVNGNIFTNQIMAANLTEGITVIGDLIIDNDFVLQANVILANTITSPEGDEITIEATDMIILNSPTVVVTGNIEADEVCAPTITTDLLEPKNGGAIYSNAHMLPVSSNIQCLGAMNQQWSKVYTHDLIATGNVWANIMNLLPMGNVVMADIVCANGEVQTDRIVSKTGGAGGTVTIDGDVNLMGGNITNVTSITPSGGSGNDLELCGNINMKGGDVTNVNNISTFSISPVIGNVAVCGNLEIKSGGDIFVTEGDIITNDGDVVVNQGDMVVNDGDVNLTGGNITNVTNIIPSPSGTGNVLVCGTLEVKNGGDIVVNEGDLNLTDGNIVNVTNIMPSTSGTGNVQVCGSLEIKDGGDLVVNEGDVVVNQGDVNLTGGNITNVTNIMPSPSDTGNVQVCGTLEVKDGGDLIVNEGDMVVNQGDVVVNQGDLNLTDGNIVNVTNIMPSTSGTGNVQVCGSLEVKDGGDLIVNEGDVVVNQGDLNLTDGNIINVTNIMPSTSGTGNVQVCGNLEIKDGGDLIVNEGDMIVNQGDMIVNQGDLNLTDGNIINVTNIMPSTSGSGNVQVCGNLEVKDGGDLVVNEGDIVVNQGDVNLTGGNITNVTNIVGDPVTGNIDLCGNVNLKIGTTINMNGGNITNVTNITTTETGGNVTVSGNLDMMCGEIFNLQTLRVDDVFGKASPVNFQDEINMTTAGSRITFEDAVLIGENASTLQADDVVIGRRATRDGSVPSAGNVVLIGTDVHTSWPQAVCVGTRTDGHLRSVAVGYWANAQSQESVSVGAFSEAIATRSIAIGNNAKATGIASMAIGLATKSYGTVTLAIGNFANASVNTYNLALGHGSSPVPGPKSIGSRSIAVGQASYSSGTSSIAIGADSVISQGAQATADNAISVGRNSDASSASAIAIGNSSKGFGTNSTAVGPFAYAYGFDSVALGYSAVCHGNTSVALGDSSYVAPNADNNVSIKGTANGSNSIAIKGTTAANNSIALLGTAQLGSVAIGSGATTSVTGHSVSVGWSASSTGQYGVAIGRETTATGQSSIAIGGGNAIYSATSTGSSSIAIGRISTAGANNTIAIGRGATASVASGIAMGNGANSDNSNSVAIGTSARAGNVNSIAIGTNAVTKGDNRALAIGLNPMSVITSGAVPYLQCVVNGSNYEIPLAVVSGGVGNGNLIVSNIICANTRVETDLIVPKSAAGNVVITGNVIVPGTLYANEIGGNSPVDFIDEINVTSEGARITFESGVQIGNGSTVAPSTNSVAVGKGASAAGTNQVCIGPNARTLTNSGRIAIGSGATALSAGGSNQIAIGTSVISYGEQSITIGASSNTESQRAVTIGVSVSNSTSHESVVIGYDSSSSASRGSVVVGPDSSASAADSSVVVGNVSSSSGASAIAIGKQTTSVFQGIALGYQANSSSTRGIAIGTRTRGAGANSVAIGGGYATNNGAFANAEESLSMMRGSSVASSGSVGAIAVGAYAMVTGSSRGAICIGSRTNLVSAPIAGATAAIAIGSNSSATGGASIAIGGTTAGVAPNPCGAVATTQGAIAMGAQSRSGGVYSIAIGSGNGAVDDDGAVATGTESIAIGHNSTATGNPSIAIGTSASATVEDGVAIGDGASVSMSTRSFALNVHNDSIITTGIPHLRAVVNGVDREIPLTVTGLGGGGNIMGNIATSVFRIDQSNSIPLTIPNGAVGDTLDLTGGTESSSNSDPPGTWAGDTFTLNRSGWFHINTSVDFEPLDQTSTIQLLVNNDDSRCIGHTQMHSLPGNAVISLDCTDHFEDGDELKIQVKQNTTGSKDVYNSHFTIHALTGVITTTVEEVISVSGNARVFRIEQTTPQTITNGAAGENLVMSLEDIQNVNSPGVWSVDTFTVSQSGWYHLNAGVEYEALDQQATLQFLINDDPDDCIGHSNMNSLPGNAIISVDCTRYLSATHTVKVHTKQQTIAPKNATNGYFSIFAVTGVSSITTDPGNAQVYHIKQSGTPQSVTNGNVGANVMLSVENSNNIQAPGSWVGDTFTVTTDGWYHLNGGVEFEPLDQQATLQFLVNDSPNECIGHSNMNSTPGNAVISIDCTTYLTTSDTIKLHTVQQTDAAKDINNSYFSIFAITGLSNTIGPSVTIDELCVDGNAYIGNLFGKSPINVHDDLNFTASGNAMISFPYSVSSPMGIQIGSRGGPNPTNSNYWTHIAIGHQSRALANGGDCIAIGFKSRAESYQGPIAIGRDAAAVGYGDVAIGLDAMSTGLSAGYNVAIGSQALQGINGGEQNVCIGYNSGSSVTNGNCNTILGWSAGAGLAEGEQNTILGSSAGAGMSGGPRGIAIGHRSLVAGGNFNDMTAIGSYTRVTGSGGIAIGSGPTSVFGARAGTEAIAIGTEARAYNYSMAFGTACQTGTTLYDGICMGRYSYIDNGGYESIVLGYYSGVRDSLSTGLSGRNIVMGWSVYTDARFSIVIGSDARITLDGQPAGSKSDSAIAIGEVARVAYGSQRAIAIGRAAFAGGDAPDSIAIGSNTDATEPNAIAIGLNSQAQVQDGVAIGNGAQATTTTRSFALNVNDSSIISGAAPHLQCVVNGVNREIPITNQPPAFVGWVSGTVGAEFPAFLACPWEERENTGEFQTTGNIGANRGEIFLDSPLAGNVDGWFMVSGSVQWEAQSAFYPAYLEVYDSSMMTWEAVHGIAAGSEQGFSFSIPVKFDATHYRVRTRVQLAASGTPIAFLGPTPGPGGTPVGSWITVQRITGN